MDDQKLNYKQAAELAGMPLGTLYSLVFQKRIPHIRFGKRLVRFSKNEIENWMKSHEVKVGEQV